jgi:hypothetical protein
MAQTIVGWIALGGALIGLIYAVAGRWLGVHRPGRWQGGGTVTLIGELALCAFAASIGAWLIHNSGIWVIPAFAAWLVARVSHNRANRRHQREEDELRERNAHEHPGIFDALPPVDIDALGDEEVDLYDAGACTYLGRVQKADMRALIDAFANVPEQDPNDLYVEECFLERVPAEQMSESLAALLHDAFQRREYLVLRWMPPSQRVS